MSRRSESTHIRSVALVLYYCTVLKTESAAIELGSIPADYIFNTVQYRRLQMSVVLDSFLAVIRQALLLQCELEQRFDAD